MWCAGGVVEGWRSLRNRSAGSFGDGDRRGDRATAPGEDIRCEKIRGQLQGMCVAFNVRFELTATDFRFAANDAI